MVISVITFSLMRVTPGDPVRIMMGNDSNPQLEAAIRAELRLDQPVIVQYVEWLGGAVRGDLGRSIRTREPVSKLIGDRIGVTLSLAVLSMVAALGIAIVVGVLAASRRNSLVDHVSMLLATIAWSVPNFVVAMLLIVVVAVQLRLLPITGSGAFFADPGGTWRSYVMPVTALTLSRAAVMARMVRSGLLEVLRRDYMRTAVAKGLPRRDVLLHHALRNALLPVVTIAAINFGYLLGGAVVVEQVFGLAGVGSLLVGAVYARDFPVIQGVTMLAAVSFVAANLAADLAYAVIDPRIRYT